MVPGPLGGALPGLGDGDEHDGLAARDGQRAAAGRRDGEGERVAGRRVAKQAAVDRERDGPALGRPCRDRRLAGERVTEDHLACDALGEAPDELLAHRGIYYKLFELQYRAADGRTPSAESEKLEVRR